VANGWKPKKFVVVGGGTAGWLAALILKEGARRSGLTVEISVVEASAIPTIGVGEGTTAVFRGLLLELGFDEFEFLRETEATIKYGIRHRDWRRVGHCYDGPIDDPQTVAGEPPGQWLNQYCIAAGVSVNKPHLFTYLMDHSRAPFVPREGRAPLPVGPFHHAYHFDQALVGRYLRDKATGVDRIDAVVKAAARDAETGNVTHLLTGDGREIVADFFVDCTGFRRALIAREMGARWVSYRDRLPVNRAMPFWLDHPEGSDMPAYTHAWAQRAGWLWQIPTQARMGCGYVYSDAFTTPEQAQAEIEDVLGRPIEPRNDIRIDAGRLDRPWIGNCLAVGLAQSFFEPLEATSIHGTIVQLMLFTQRHLRAVAAGRLDPNRYHEDIARQVDDFCDFINVHYVSERRDTPFWMHVAEECIGKEVRARLTNWQGKTPSRSDFRPFPGGLPHVEDQLYVPVLDGLGLTGRNAARAELKGSPALRKLARTTVQRLARDFRRAASRAPGHSGFLNGLRQT